jgi:YVTN family beta-propeller protein
VVPSAGTPQVYVCNYAYASQPGTTITPINVTDRLPEHRVTIASLPSAVASTPDGRHLVVTAQGDNLLVVLDTATDAVSGRVTTGLEPDAVAVTPDGRTAVVANFGDATVTLVDLTTLRALRTIAVGSQPDAVAVTPDGRTAVVANFGDATVTPVDLVTMTAGPPIAVGSQPDAVAITPDGRTAVVANFGDATVTPVDLVTARAQPPVPVGPGPAGIVISATSPAGDAAAWVAVGASLVPVALTTWAPGAPVAVGHIAEALALADGGRTAWVAGQDGAVLPVDLSTGRTGRAAHVLGRPSAIAVAPPSH